METEYVNPEADIKNFLLLMYNSGKREFTDGEIREACHDYESSRLQPYLDGGVIVRTPEGFRIACGIEELRAATINRGAGGQIKRGQALTAEEIFSSEWELAGNTSDDLNEMRRRLSRTMFCEHVGADGSEDVILKEIDGFMGCTDDDDDEEEEDDEPFWGDKPFEERVKRVRGDFSDSVYVSRCDRGLTIKINGLSYRNGTEAKFLMFSEDDRIFVSDFGEVHSALGDKEFLEFAELLDDTDIIVGGDSIILDITEKDTFTGIMELYSLANTQIC